MGARNWIAGSLVALSLSAAASAQPLVIQFAEPVQIPAASNGVSIDAHGRRFDLSLEANERLLQGMSAARRTDLDDIRLLRGRVNGRADTWVRLTRSGAHVSGAFWDGTDLYMISPYRDVSAYLSTPLGLAPDQPVVYRLADTLNLLPASFCATGPRAGDAAGATGLAQYKALVNELKIAFVGVPTDQLDISLVADSVLTAQYANYSPPSGDVRVPMLSTLNVVDGIFDAQFGLMLTASELHRVPPAADTLVSDDASALLDQLRQYRSAVPALQAKPISHLFSSRNLSSNVIGIAQIGGACTTTGGVSLTSVGTSGFSPSNAFVMAHEIGHNLNAEHDTAACGDTFLMWPEYSSRTQGRFSQCSVDQIRPFIAQNRGACITPAQYSDVEARIASIPEPIRLEPFTWPIYIRSTGNLPANDVVVFVHLTGEYFGPVTPTQGSCAPGGGPMRCNLGTIAPGVEARIDLGINPLSTGRISVQANVDATGDRYSSNDVASGEVTVRTAANLDISMTPTAATAFAGDVVSFTYTITTSGPRTAQAVRFAPFDGGSVQYVSLTPSRGTCNSFECNLGNMASGSTAQVVVRLRPIVGGQMTVGGRVEAPNANLTGPEVLATLDVTATIDLAIGPQPDSRLVAIGVPFDIVVPVRANGTRPVIAGLFRMVLAGARYLAADVDGTPCASNLLQSAQGSGCTLGTLNPGDSRTVTVRAVFDAPADTSIYMAAEIPYDELGSNNFARTLFRARHATDVSLDPTFSGAGEVEGVEFPASVTMRSQGAQDSPNVTTTFDAPVGIRIVSASLPQGTCTPSGDRRISCVRDLVLNEPAYMTVRLVGDAPGQSTGTWTISAANDGVPSNNTRTVDIRIWPLADVGITPIPALPVFIIGQPREFNVDVFTGTRRPVENVVVTLPSSQNLVLEAVSTPVGSCDIAPPSPRCSLGTLAPGSQIRLVPRYRATAMTSISAWVSVQAAFDTNFNNNNVHVDLNAYDAGDVEGRLAATTAAGTVGTNIALPRITVNTLVRAYDIRVDVPLPSFTTVQTIAGNATCTGGVANSLQCWLGSREAGAVDNLDITVRLDSTGTFTSNVVVSAANDTNAANGTGSFQLQSSSVVTPQPPATGGGSGGGGGGGGGGIDWLLLWGLAVLALRAAFSRAGPGKTDRAFSAGNCGTRRHC